MKHDEDFSSTLRYCGPHLFHAVHKPATLHSCCRLPEPREIERVAMVVADRVLETVLVVLTKQPTDVHVVGDSNILAADTTIIIPVIHAAHS